MTAGTQSFIRRVSFTRPNDSTQYSAGDGVADATTSATAATFELTNMASSLGGSGKITGVTLHKTDQDQTGADFDIYFFDTQPVATGFDDNAAIAITDAEWKQCVGFVQLVASADVVSVVTGDLYCRTNLDLNYKCVTGSTTLYYVVVARGTYTPFAQEVFTLTVTGEMH